MPFFVLFKDSSKSLFSLLSKEFLFERSSLTSLSCWLTFISFLTSMKKLFIFILLLAGNYIYSDCPEVLDHDIRILDSSDSINLCKKMDW